MVAIVVVQAVGEGAVEQSGVARARCHGGAPESARTLACMRARETQQRYANLLGSRQNRYSETIEDRSFGVVQCFFRRRLQLKGNGESGEFFGQLLGSVR